MKKISATLLALACAGGPAGTAGHGGLALAAIVPEPATKVESDPSLRFPVPGPTDLPLVRDGKASLEELVAEGERNWWSDAQLEGEPFGIPEEVFDLYFGKVPGVVRDEVIKIIEAFAQSGLHHVKGEELPRGLVRARAPGRAPLVTQNCSACHSGVVNGKLIAGVGNKRYDQRVLISGSRLLMRSARPFLRAAGRIELLRQVDEQLEKLERYDALYGTGCEELGPGMITAARIWQISSKLLHDPAQLSTPEGLAKFGCGETKPPPLNTLRFRNLYFWDGAVNTLWVAHWPMFDFFGFDDYGRWERKVSSREIQALDAFLTFGLKSPDWESVLGTRVDAQRAARGFKLFHRPRSCASCHGSYSPQGMLTGFKPSITPLDVIRTDPRRAVAAFDELLREFTRYGWAYVPRLDPELGPERERYRMGYQPYPLCSPFLNYPYLHTGAVANLYELLMPESKRHTSYWLSDSIDKRHAGYHVAHESSCHGRRGEAPLLEKEVAAKARLRTFSPRLVAGHSGPEFGTELSEPERLALLEYLKTLRCPDSAR